MLKPLHLPMLRHVAEPFDAGGLEADILVEAAGHGPVDEGLLLLFQQLDQLLLGADVAPDPAVHVVEESCDLVLFLYWCCRDDPFIGFASIEAWDSRVPRSIIESDP